LKIKNKTKNSTRKIFFFTLALFFIFAPILVAVRMATLQIRYKKASLNQEFSTLLAKNKELKLKKANALSIKNLRFFAQKHKMHQPKADHIIVIPWN